MDIVRELTPLTPEIALPLYVAISTDTGGFIYSNVTAATHRAAAELMDTGIDYRAVNKLFFQTKSRVRMQLEAAMLAEAKFYDNNRTAVLSVPQSLLEKFHATESDAEDLSALGPQIQGVDCAVTMRELGDGVWKFSLRTGERVNATEVCRLLGGGGHARAAGATLEGVTQAEAEGKMLDAIAGSSRISRNEEPPMASGIVIIDKPSGWTSMDVCAKIRGILKEKRVGHGGTLDPMATGVLPVFVGQATRAVEFAENGEKEYIAGLRLGLVTNTQDTSGETLETHPVTVDRAVLEAVLPRFTGPIAQIPPMYSAIKINGQKLYDLARKARR